MIARARQPLDAHRQSGRHRLWTFLDVSLELRVCKPHFVLIELAEPQACAWRPIDDGPWHAKLLRHLANLALQEMADRQQIGAAVAVLREVPDGQLRSIAGPRHQAVDAVRD